MIRDVLITFFTICTSGAAVLAILCSLFGPCDFGRCYIDCPGSFEHK
jgi:hypothetical protein